MSICLSWRSTGVGSGRGIPYVRLQGRAYSMPTTGTVSDSTAVGQEVHCTLTDSLVIVKKIRDMASTLCCFHLMLYRLLILTALVNLCYFPSEAWSNSSPKHIARRSSTLMMATLSRSLVHSYPALSLLLFFILFPYLPSFLLNLHPPSVRCCRLSTIDCPLTSKHFQQPLRISSLGLDNGNSTRKHRASK